METELKPVFKALEDFQDEQDYGTAIDAGGFSARIADAPIGVSVKAMFGDKKTEVPAADLYKRFAVWLIPVRFSIIRRSGKAEVTAVGVECDFLNGKKTCCVVSLIPTPQFIDWGGATGNFKFAGSLSVAGDLSALNKDGGTLPELPKVALAQDAGLEIAAHFAVNVITPYISAVGVGSQHVEWRFDRYKEALFGRDIECWAAVALPKDQTTLEMRVRAYMMTRTAFFPTRRESDWQQFTCQLSG